MRPRSWAIRVRFAASTLTLLIALGAVSCAASREQARDKIAARLTIEFERSRYRIGEPVVGLVTLQNLSSNSISDIPAIDLLGNRLQLIVRDLNRSTDVRRRGLFIDYIYTDSGLALGPNESYVEVLDLSKHYGAIPDSEQCVQDALMRFVLQPGWYEVRATIVPSTSARGGVPRAPLASDPVRFEVAGGDSGLADDKIWRELVSVPWQRNRVSPADRDVSKRLLRDSASSAWFWLIYDAVGSDLTETNFGAVLGSLRNDQVPALRSTIAIARRYERPLRDEARYLKVLDQRSQESESGSERNVITSLRLKATQRKYIHWAPDDAYQ